MGRIGMMIRIFILPIMPILTISDAQNRFHNHPALTIPKHKKIVRMGRIGMMIGIFILPIMSILTILQMHKISFITTQLLPFPMHKKLSGWE